MVNHVINFINKKSNLFPENFVTKINNIKQINQKRQLLLVSELLKLAEMLNCNKIKWINLKGPALSYQLYSDAFYRNSIDIDILIDEKDFKKIIDLLATSNYVITKKILTDNFLKYHSELTVKPPESETQIEIHWKFAPYQQNKQFSFKYYYNNTEKICINNTNIATLNLNEHFLYVCRHGFTHQWNSLYWLVDIKMFREKLGDNIIDLKQKNPFVSGAMSFYDMLYYNAEIDLTSDIKFFLKSVSVSNKNDLRKLDWRVKRGLFFANIEKSKGSFWYYVKYLLYKLLMSK